MDEKAIRGKAQSVLYNTPSFEDPEIVGIHTNEDNQHEVLVDDPSNEFGYKLLIFNSDCSSHKWEDNEVNPTFVERFIGL